MAQARTFAPTRGALDDNKKEIKLQNSETERIKKAWNYLYFQEGKKVKLLMDSTYRRK
jgi:hypothetical protein